MTKNNRNSLPTVFLLLGLIFYFNGGLVAQPTPTSSDVAVNEPQTLEQILQATSDPAYESIEEALKLVPKGLLEAQKQKRHQDKIKLLLNGANMCEKLGDIVEAKKFWKSAIAIIENAQPSASIGKLYAQYGAFLRLHAEPHAAIEQLFRAASAFNAAREANLLIETKQEISHIYAEEGYSDEALEQAESALSSAMALNDLTVIGDAYRAKAISQMIAGQTHQRDFGHFILKTIQLLHEPTPEALTIDPINELALETLQSAIDHYKEAGNTRRLADSMRLKGDIMLYSHKINDAANYYVQSYQGFSNSGTDGQFIDLQVSMAAQQTMVQKIDTASRTINAAISANQNPLNTPWLLLLKSEISLKDFNDPEARETLIEGIAMAERTQDLDQLIALNQLLSLVEINLGNYRQSFIALDTATRFQIQQISIEKEQLQKKRDFELKELKQTISENSQQRSHELENQLFSYESFAKRAWLIALTFVVCFIGLIALRLSSLRQKIIELEATKNAVEEAKEYQNTVFKSLAQELRTPMNGIVGSIPLLRDANLDSFQENCINIMDASSRSITTLINDISDLSQLESGKFRLTNQRLSLTNITETVVQLFEADAEKANVQIICNVPSDPIPFFNGDPNRIQQILITLIGRSLQSTYEGNVFVTVETLVPTSERTLQARITVEDTGNRPSAEALKDFFGLNPSASIANSLMLPASMMGMPITQKLVDSMNGTIQVNESQKHGGMKIRVTIPFTLEPDQETWTTPNAFERFPRKRALIIDRSEHSANALTSHLRAWALSFETVEDVNSASKYMDQNHEFDIIFLDTCNPVHGLSLLEQIAAIRSHQSVRNTPIILLSNLSRQHLSLELSRQRYIHQVAKPFNIQQLHASISQAIHFKSPVSKSYASLTPAISTEDTDRLGSTPEPATNEASKNSFHFMPFILPMRQDIEVDPGLKILLAEDNVVNQKVTTLMLKKMGYEIDIVPNGKQSVEAVSTGDYDVVLMDKIMPVMDGLEASREIRKLEGIEQPIIIALTASATMEDEIACRKASMDNFLAKPVRLEKMKAALGFATSVLKERKPRSKVESAPTTSLIKEDDEAGHDDAKEANASDLPIDETK